MLKKVIKFIITTIIFFIFINIINALENDSVITKTVYDNMYAVYDGTDRIRLFNAEKYSFGNKTAYCIEPLKPINVQAYSSTENFNSSGLDKDLQSYINLVAYYGYDYKNHNHMNYYLAAQELIWEGITKREVYWIEGTDKNGPRINIENEKNEILNLIANHNKLPSFDGKTIDITLGSKIDISDDNNILSEYTITNSDIIDLTIEENYLKNSDPKKVKNAVVVLAKKPYYENNPILYYSTIDKQKLISAGKQNSITSTLNINLKITAKLRIINVDKETDYPIHQNEIYIKIKNMKTGEDVCQTDNCMYRSNSSGVITTPYPLPEGLYSYYQVENIYISGYTRSTEEVLFTIDSNQNYKTENNDYILEIIHRSEPIKGKIIIDTYGEKPMYQDNNFTYDRIKLNNVSYELSAKTNIYSSYGRLLYSKGNIINTITTSNGNITIDNLAIGGTYCLKQTKTENSHTIYEEPYCFAFRQYGSNEKEIVINKEIKNIIPKGTFNLVKIDNDTKNPLNNTLIEIYTLDDELILSSYTDEEGKITITNIPKGSYYYIEKEPKEGYVLDSTKHYFEINEDNLLVDAILENKKNNIIHEKVIVPDTYKNSLIITILELIKKIYEKI